MNLGHEAPTMPVPVHSTFYEGSCWLRAFDAIDSHSDVFTLETPATLGEWAAENSIELDVIGGIAITALIAAVVSGRFIFKQRWVRWVAFTACTALLIINVLGFYAVLVLPNHHWRLLSPRMLETLLVCVVLSAVFLLKRVHQQDERMQSRLDEAQRIVTEVQFPVVLLRGDHLLKLGKLLSHEEVRGQGILVFLDTVDEANRFLRCNVYPDNERLPGSTNYFEDTVGTDHFGIFFSHQWTAQKEPDPDGVQYTTMCAASRTISREFGMALDSVYVWVDYFSIPQANAHAQRLAINSLPMYASLLQAFVIVAPRVKHKELQVDCDTASYYRRGWCRAEQLCHCARRGTRNVFLAVDAETTDNDSGVSMTSSVEAFGHVGTGRMGLPPGALEVFDAKSEFSCCDLRHIRAGEIIPCDREALVLPMLGLYAEIYKMRRDPEFNGLFRKIARNRDKVFPPNFTYITPNGPRQRVLFGDLVDRLEQRMDFEAAQKAARDAEAEAAATRTSWEARRLAGPFRRKRLFSSTVPLTEFWDRLRQATWRVWRPRARDASIELVPSASSRRGHNGGTRYYASSSWDATGLPRDLMALPMPPEQTIREVESGSETDSDMPVLSGVFGRSSLSSVVHDARTI